jgi:hypothetical protein
VPPPFGAGGRGRHGLGRRELGEKPKMWEAWVGKDREVLRGGGSVDCEEGEKKMSKWEGILVGIFFPFFYTTTVLINPNLPPRSQSQQLT